MRLLFFWMGITSSLLPWSLQAEFEPIIGILGSSQNSSLTPGQAYAALLQSDRTLRPLEPLPASDGIFNVAINDFGRSIIYGTDASENPFAALVSPSGQLTVLPVSGDPIPRFSSSQNVYYWPAVAASINNANLAFLGGYFGTSSYATFIDPTGHVTKVDGIPGDYILAARMNNSGLALVGGFDGNGGFASYVWPDTTILDLDLGLTGVPEIISVAINDFGTGIIAGTEPAEFPYAALVSPSGSVSPIDLSPCNVQQDTGIYFTAINNSGTAIIGGGHINISTIPPLAAFVLEDTTLVPIDPSLLPNYGYVSEVDINSSGKALIGGVGSDTSFGSSFPFAAFASLDDGVTPLGPFPSVGNNLFIESVAINDFGFALIGGAHTDSNAPYAVLVLPDTRLIELQFNIDDGYIWSVDLIKGLSYVPSGSLHANNRSLARYITRQAPEKASYFLPALALGSLPDALERVAPTRNAASLYTASHNFFTLNQNLSRHLRSQQHFFLKPEKKETPQEPAKRDLVASRGELPKGFTAPQKKLPPLALWVDLFGAFSRQAAEHQTPAFHPLTGGAIVALEASLDTNVHFGGGAAYTYTHIHHEKGFGYADIHQPYFFLYSFYRTEHFYIDSAIWEGSFHIHQKRNMDIPAFDFQATSSPEGWQLCPHLELGLEYQFGKPWFVLQPFVMGDWVNAWQQDYEESGSSPFNMAQKAHYGSLLRCEAGFRFFETINFALWRFVWMEKASFVNKKPFDIGTVNAFIVGSPGSFTVETLSTPQNAGLIEICWIFEPKDTSYPFGLISYQGEFSAAYQSHQASAEVCWNF